MAKQLWYHGGVVVTDLSKVRWDRARNADQNAGGPGIYWTTDRAEGARYDSTVFQGTTKTGFRTLPARASMTLALAIFNAAPPSMRRDFLAEWGDVAPREALANYASQDDGLDTAVLLYHDLFHYDASAYVAAMATLYDGAVISFPATLLYKKRKHLVLWSFRSFDFERARPGKTS